MDAKLLDVDIEYGATPQHGKGKDNKFKNERPIQLVLGPMVDDSDMDPAKKAKLSKTDLIKFRRMVFYNGDIHVYDDKGKVVGPSIIGRRIRAAIQIDKSFTYTISDKRFAWDNQKKSYSVDGKVMTSGLYLYDY